MLKEVFFFFLFHVRCVEGFACNKYESNLPRPEAEEMKCPNFWTGRTVPKANCYTVGVNNV